MKKSLVITSIHKPTKAVLKMQEVLKDWHVIIVGDKKTPDFVAKDITFLSVSKQSKSGLMSNEMPYNHYARKNLGYLYAIANKTEILYETDDDNFPYHSWNFPAFESQRVVETNESESNVYKYFSDEYIWPRGFPLDKVHDTKDEVLRYRLQKTEIGVWQGLADKDPDVDSLYRLLVSKPVTFQQKPAIALPDQVYCPFNSQNTLWKKEFFPLLYLPSSVNSRFCDILRGYVALRILWHHGHTLGFTQATVYQERNEHNLLKDFSDELELLTKSRKVIDILKVISFNSDDIFENLVDVYTALVENEVVFEEEMSRVQNWIYDFKSI